MRVRVVSRGPFAGKPQLSFHSGNIHLPLPYTDSRGLARYMTLNRSDRLVLTYFDVRSRPGLAPIWNGERPQFTRTFETGPTGKFEIKGYRFVPDKAVNKPGGNGRIADVKRNVD